MDLLLEVNTPAGWRPSSDQIWTVRSLKGGSYSRPTAERRRRHSPRPFNVRGLLLLRSSLPSQSFSEIRAKLVGRERCLGLLEAASLRSGRLGARITRMSVKSVLCVCLFSEFLSLFCLLDFGCILVFYAGWLSWHFVSRLSVLVRVLWRGRKLWPTVPSIWWFGIALFPEKLV